MVQMAESLQSGGMVLSPGLIEAYLQDLERRGRADGTMSTYRKKLQQLYTLLPEDKCIRAGTLQSIRRQMQAEGNASGTINILCAAANGLLEYCGRRELQIPNALDIQKTIQPDMSRAEYRRLLSTARTCNKHRAYLMIKVFANIGIYVRELPAITAEAVREGKLILPQRGMVYIPAPLRAELLHYCAGIGKTTGPVFTTAAGKNMNRSAINAEIRRLAADAQVPEEKCNPLVLRRLYLETQESIRQSMALLMEQAYDRLLEQEQLTVGWENAAI